MTYGSPNLEVQVGGDHAAPLTQTDARRGRGGVRAAPGGGASRRISTLAARAFLRSFHLSTDGALTASFAACEEVATATHSPFQTLISLLVYHLSVGAESVEIPTS